MPDPNSTTGSLPAQPMPNLVIPQWGPGQVMQTDLSHAIHEQFATLAHKQVTVSYAILGVLVLVMALAGVGGWLGLRAYEGQIARAQAAEMRYEDAQKAFATTLAQHDAERAADAKESAALIAQIAARAKQPLPPVIQEGMKPGAAAVDVKNALGAVLSDRHPEGVPMAVQGENLEISPVSAQVWLADEVLLNRISADLTDTQRLLSLAERDRDSALSDLKGAKSTLSEAQKTIDAYKKVAVKSRWRKFLDGALKVGLVAGGVAFGAAITH